MNVRKKLKKTISIIIIKTGGGRAGGGGRGRGGGEGKGPGYSSGPGNSGPDDVPTCRGLGTHVPPGIVCHNWC